MVLAIDVGNSKLKDVRFVDDDRIYVVREHACSTHTSEPHICGEEGVRANDDVNILVFVPFFAKTLINTFGGAQDIDFFVG